MKPIVPLSAIIIYSSILLLIGAGILPDPLMITEYIQTMNPSYLFFIILLESIIYVGFYLPGQFIAVLLVFSYASNFLDVLFLSIISIIAVTIGAFINYNLGYYYFKNKNETQENIHYKSLLLSMIHINTIALYIFDQGQKAGPKKIIYLTGVLNFPYYILIIGVTFLLKNEILSMSENAYILFGILFLWLGFSIYKEKTSKTITKH